MKWIKFMIGVLVVTQFFQTISIICLIKDKQEQDKKIRVVCDALYVGITQDEFEKQNYIKPRTQSAIESVKQYYNYMVK